MRYRKFGQLDWKVSALGFGCMRLPIKGGDEHIDEPEATHMLHFAIDRGVNYVDTAYGYHQGNSERFLGRALADGYRERIRLATKLPCWLVESAVDFDRFFDEQMERLQTDRFDFYLLHALNKKSWLKVRDLGIIRWAERAMSDGLIGHLGFSFHDDYPTFVEIVDSYDWTLCQIQYNYMDLTHQAGERGLKYAASKGIAIVVMEPMLGGKLVDSPERIRRIWERSPRGWSPAGWALQWLWNQPEISVVLSGMSSIEQVEENLASAGKSAVGSLTPEEMELVAQVRRSYRAMGSVPCTGCNYCMPCPNGVDIPENFRFYNQSAMYCRFEQTRTEYEYGWASLGLRASACTSCRQCEQRCPQRILISEWMDRVHAELGKDIGRSQV